MGQHYAQRVAYQRAASQMQGVPKQGAWRRFWSAYWRGVRWAVFIAILGVILIGGLRTGERSPVKAERAIEAQRRERVLNQQYEEDERQAEYAATPGSPQPTARLLTR
jgi:hypothetical protein